MFRAKRNSGQPENGGSMKKNMKKSLLIFSILGVASLSLSLAKFTDKDHTLSLNTMVEQGQTNSRTSLSSNDEMTTEEMNRLFAKYGDEFPLIKQCDYIMNEIGSGIGDSLKIASIDEIEYTGENLGFKMYRNNVSSVTLKAGVPYILHTNGDYTININGQNQGLYSGNIAVHDMLYYVYGVTLNQIQSSFSCKAPDYFICDLPSTYPESFTERESSLLSNYIPQKIKEKLYPTAEYICLDGSVVIIPAQDVILTPNIENGYVGEEPNDEGDLQRVMFGAELYFQEFVMLDKIAPDFDENDYVFTSNVDNPLSIETILSSIHATDGVDGDVSNKVRLVSTTYDPENLVLGSHDFTVSVTDASGNVATATFRVSVYDIMAPTYICSITNVSYQTKLTQEKIMNMVAFSDNFSSVIVTLNQEDYASYENNYTSLKYHSFRVTGTDTAGNATTITIDIPVIDDVKPTGTSSNISQGCSTKLTDNQIKAMFTYNDEKGSCTIEITNDSDYQTNYASIGEYAIDVRITDESGNYIDVRGYITVIDDIAPTANNASTTAPYTTTFSKEDILALVQGNDNYSSVTKTVNEDDYRAYLASSNKLGSYNIRIVLTDTAGNVGGCTATIVVEDKTAPIITGPGKIETGISGAISLENLKSKISVVDGYDGVITNYSITGFDAYTAAFDEVGTYSITISATDSSGNTATVSFSIVTKDDIAPDFWIASDYVITVPKGTTVTNEMIISFLSQIGEINVNDVANVNFEMDPDTAGVYRCSVLMKNGTVYEANVAVKNDTPEEPGYFEKLWKDFTNTDNIFKFENWNWLHYVAAGIAGLLVISVIASLVKRKK